MYNQASTHPCLDCFHNCNDFCDREACPHHKHFVPWKEDKIYVLYDKEGVNTEPIIGVFNQRLRAEEVLNKIIEKILAEILAVDPHESGIIDPTDLEIRDLRKEIADSFDIIVFPHINTFRGEV